MPNTELTPLAKDGDYIEVHPTTVAHHLDIGWKACDRIEIAVDLGSAKLNLSAAQLREELAMRGIGFTTNASKKELEALLADAAHAQPKE